MFLRFDAPLCEYVKQADQLFAGWQSGDELAVRVFRANHPKFLDDTIPWLERRISDAEARAIPITRDDASMAVARAYNFRDWPALEAYATAVADTTSPVSRFEQAVEAVIDGDAATLARLLRDDPELVRARSTRVCNYDPPIHRSTLLHYLAANGVEGYRQRSPKNAVAIARILLDAGADPNALHDSYGGQNTTMAMLVSSTPPKEAGVQVPLVDILIDRGANVEPNGAGPWTSPLETALAFGMHDAARALVRRGAVVATLAAAAGLGRVDDVKQGLPGASPLDRHRALAMAAQAGHVDIVGLLIDAGEDPNRYNPPGLHSHAQPLHQAVAAGHLEVVQLLIDRGARVDTRDTIHSATPLRWAEHCAQPAIAALLRAHQTS